MLTLSEIVILLPRWSRVIFPFWKRFIQAWDDISNTCMTQKEPTLRSNHEIKRCLVIKLSWFLCSCLAAQTLINRRIAEIEAQVARRQPVEGMYLTYLLSSDKMSRAEIYTCITELLLGGVDTVRWEKKVPQKNISPCSETRISIPCVKTQSVNSDLVHHLNMGQTARCHLLFVDSSVK